MTVICLVVMALWLLALVWDIWRQEIHLTKEAAMRRGLWNLIVIAYRGVHRLIDFGLIRLH